MAFTDAIAVTVAWIAAIDPVRTGRTLASVGRRAVAAGLVAFAGIALVAAGSAGPLARGLDVSAPTLQVAAGFVLVPVGVARLVRAGVTSPWPAPPGGWLAAFVPVLYPLLLTPAAVLLAVGAGVDGTAWVVAATATPALGLTIAEAGSAVPLRLATAASRLLAAALVITGVGLTYRGVFAI